MSGNTYGKIFSLTTFGESHGIAIGGIIDGCPAGLEIDLEFIQAELDRRKPGQSSITSTRKESDSVFFLSGIVEGKTLGTPIGFSIANENQKEKDYDYLKEAYRPSHADYTYQQKYGVRDYRGGGRSSARETACRVVAGAIAKLFLRKYGITINAYTSQIGEIKLLKNYQHLNFSLIEKNAVRCPDVLVAETMIHRIEQVKKAGDTIGGVVSCVVKNRIVGLGEPVFDKLNAELAKAMLSINAAKGFEVGSGFEGASMQGSQQNDSIEIEKKLVKRKTNNGGGIEGGMSNGEDIYFRVAFKPVSTIMIAQKSINNKNEEIHLENNGRHDPCVVPRAVPIVEAMAALVFADFVLRNMSAKLKS